MNRETPAPHRHAGWLQRHPLPVFLVLGALLLGLDALRSPGGQVIRVPAAQQTAGPQVVARWIEEEVLYREAMHRGMDAGDTIVRRRLAQKMKLALDAAIEIETPDDATLEQWVSQRAERYREPARIAFDQVFVSRRHATNGGGTIDARLQAAPDKFATLGDPHPAGVRVHASSDAVLRDFGPGFMAAVFELPVDTWHGPLASGLGRHWVRVRQREEAPPVDLAAVRERATRDWMQAQREARLAQHLRALTASYRIEAGPAP